MPEIGKYEVGLTMYLGGLKQLYIDLLRPPGSDSLCGKAFALETMIGTTTAVVQLVGNSIPVGVTR